MKIVVFGTGNMGKRYLQSIYNVSEDIPVYCYDRKKEALFSIAPFLESYGLTDTSRKIRSYSEALNKIDHHTLVIVSTTADGRAQVLQDILTRHPKYVIAEKPLTQSLNELEILKTDKSIDLNKVYLNYYLRFQPYAQDIKNSIKNDESFSINVLLPSNGIACNGIHYIDLFCWLSNSCEYTIESGKVQGLYEQRRKGFEDVYGEVSITNKKGDRIHISNLECNNIQSFFVSTENTIYCIDERPVEGRVAVIEGDSSRITDLPYLYASEYLVEVISDFRNETWSSSKNLTPFREALPSHEALFDYLNLSDGPFINIT